MGGSSAVSWRAVRRSCRATRRTAEPQLAPVRATGAWRRGLAHSIARTLSSSLSVCSEKLSDDAGGDMMSESAMRARFTGLEWSGTPERSCLNPAIGGMPDGQWSGLVSAEM